MSAMDTNGSGSVYGCCAATSRWLSVAQFKRWENKSKNKYIAKKKKKKLPVIRPSGSPPKKMDGSYRLLGPVPSPVRGVAARRHTPRSVATPGAPPSLATTATPRASETASATYGVPSASFTSSYASYAVRAPTSTANPPLTALEVSRLGAWERDKRETLERAERRERERREALERDKREHEQRLLRARLDEVRANAPPPNPERDAQLMDRVTRLEGRAAEAEAAAKAAKIRITELEAELSVSRSRVAEADARARGAEAGTQEGKSEAARLQALLDLEHAALERAQSRIADLQSEVEAERTRAGETSRARSAGEARLVALQTALDSANLKASDFATRARSAPVWLCTIEVATDLPLQYLLLAFPPPVPSSCAFHVCHPETSEAERREQMVREELDATNRKMAVFQSERDESRRALLHLTGDAEGLRDRMTAQSADLEASAARIATLEAKLVDAEAVRAQLRLRDDENARLKVR